AVPDSQLTTLPDTTGLRAAALQQAPAVTQATAQERAASASTWTSRSQFWPKLTATYNTSSQGLTQPWNGFDSPTQKNLNRFTIGLSWTLFDGFTREQAVAQSSVSLDVARAQTADQRPAPADDIPHRRHAAAGHRDPHPQADPGLRHGRRGGAGAPRHRHPDPQERVRGGHGAVGLGEVDLDEPDRLPRHAHRRRILAQRPEGLGPFGRRAGPHPQQGDRVRVPDVQPAAPGPRAPQRGAAVALRRAARQRATGAGRAGARAGGAGRPDGPQAERAVG